MSSIGDPDDPYKPHSNNYVSLKVEQSLQEIPDSPPVQPEPSPELSDWEKADAKETLANEEIIAFREKEDRTINDVIDFSRKVRGMSYEELSDRKAERESRAEQSKEITDLDRAKEAALKEMDERDIPPSPEEPNRPETHGRGR